MELVNCFRSISREETIGPFLSIAWRQTLARRSSVIASRNLGANNDLTAPQSFFAKPVVTSSQMAEGGSGGLPGDPTGWLSGRTTQLSVAEAIITATSAK